MALVLVLVLVLVGAHRDHGGLFGNAKEGEKHRRKEEILRFTPSRMTHDYPSLSFSKQETRMLLRVRLQCDDHNHVA
jgi:hypothetical protein